MMMIHHRERRGVLESNQLLMISNDDQLQQYEITMCNDSHTVLTFEADLVEYEYIILPII